MRKNKSLVRLTVLLLLAFGGVGAHALAAAPSFTMTVKNITMPTNGNGSTPLTVTAVNGYTGTIVLGCVTPTPPSGTLEPYCGPPPHFGPALSTVLTASEPTVTVNFPITSFVEPTASSKLNSHGHGEGAGLALAGVLMFGFGLGKRKSRRTFLLLAVGMFLGLTGIIACGGGNIETLTPGTYTYLIRGSGTGTGAYANTHNITASTTVEVTVPPGIPVQTQPGNDGGSF